MTRIASPLDQIQETYDVVVIGSGYGGAIAASRMARAGRKVCLLERGREFVATEFPDTVLEAEKQFQLNYPGGHTGSRIGLFDFHVNAEQNVLVGCGLGGTSLINANVSLEAKPYVFDDPLWPAALRADRDTRLQDGYARAREMLRPNPYPENLPALAKMQAHQKSALAMGQSQQFYRTPINVNFASLPNNTNHVGVEQLPCNNCGDCVSGCNFKAKNTTRMTYLPDAWNHGAEIFCQCAVSHLERADDDDADGANWVVHYQVLASGRELFDAPTQFVRAAMVIVSAGTLGSSEIMLRSKQKGLALSDQVGERFSGNGDILGFGYNGNDAINGIGYSSKQPDQNTPVGPCISSVIDMRDQPEYQQRMVIEEGVIPGALGPLLLPAFSAADAFIGQDDSHGFVEEAKQKVREADSLLRGPHHGAVQHTQTYLIMSHDSANGRMLLDQHDSLRIEWPGVGTRPNVASGNARLHEASKALGATYIPNPLWTDAFQHAIVTVHPLGGCVMGENASQGVVNHKGQVFNGNGGADGTEVWPGLYISDGAIIPTSLAVNPLLTISALTERNMALLAQDYGWRIDYSLPSAPRQPAAVDKIGLQFTETMTGFFSSSHRNPASTDLAAYEHAFEAGRDANSPMAFTLTVHSSDLDQMLTNPEHQASISGTLIAPALSPQALTVSHGVFNLFKLFDEKTGVRHMNYQMQMHAEDGSDYFFSAFKSVPKDHSILSIWHDTSTLYVTVYQGLDASGPVVGSGVLHIQPVDFIKQMGTIQVPNAKTEAERLTAVARFGKFFAGVLWENYGGILAGKH